MVERDIATDPLFIKEDQRLMALYSEGKMDMEDYYINDNLYLDCDFSCDSGYRYGR